MRSLLIDLDGVFYVGDQNICGDVEDAESSVRN